MILNLYNSIGLFSYATGFTSPRGRNPRVLRTTVRLDNYRGRGLRHGVHAKRRGLSNRTRHDTTPRRRHSIISKIGSSSLASLGSSRSCIRASGPMVVTTPWRGQTLQLKAGLQHVQEINVTTGASLANIANLDRARTTACFKG